jgi:hypothetical protein
LLFAAEDHAVKTTGQHDLQVGAGDMPKSW